MRHKSLRNKMMTLTIILVFFSVVTIAVLGVVSTTNASMQIIKSMASQIVNQVSLNVCNYSKEIESIATLWNYDYDAQLFLKTGKNMSALETERLNKRVKKLLSDTERTRNDITSIYIWNKQGQIVSDESNINYRFDASSQWWYKQALSSEEMIILTPHRQQMVENSSKLVFSIVRGLRSFDNGEIIGVMMIDLSLDTLNSICSSAKLGDTGYVILAKEGGNVLYHPDYSYLYRAWDEMYIKDAFKEDDPIIMGSYSADEIANVNGRSLLLISDEIPDLDIVVYGVYPMDQFKSIQNYTILFTMIIGSILIILGLIATLFIYSRIFTPIELLQSYMKKAESGVFECIGKYENDEIGSLYFSFDSMINQITQLMETTKKVERAKRKTELNFLQAQINPHFLYNTLDSIVWMAESGHKDVVPMTESLAKLFRIALSGGRDIIPLKDEVEHVRNYLIIQKMRYPKKFDFEINLDETLKDTPCIKLIIQPVVENAIYHGVKEIRREGLISINVSLKEGLIHITVKDNGAGMNKETLSNILNHSNKGSIGLKNVDKRIKLYYGQDFGISIKSELNIGTEVDIVFPPTEGGIQ